MATGVTVDEQLIFEFNEFKLRRGEFHLRYYIYKIENNEIVIDTSGGLDKGYDDFVEVLPENECRYGVVDVDFESNEGRHATKIVFVSWVPETAKVRDRMIYSGSKEAIKASLNGVGIHINATDFSELDWTASILPVVRKFVA